MRVEAEDGTREMRWRAALPHEFVTADSGEMLMKSRRCSDGGAGRADAMMLMFGVWVRLGRACVQNSRKEMLDFGHWLAWAGLALIDPLQTKVRDGAGRVST